MDQRRVASEIRAELGRQNLSQGHLAAALEWTEAYLSRRMTGEVDFTLAEISSIADQLGVRPAQFINPGTKVG